MCYLLAKDLFLPRLFASTQHLQPEPELSGSKSHSDSAHLSWLPALYCLGEKKKINLPQVIQPDLKSPHFCFPPSTKSSHLVYVFLHSLCVPACASNAGIHLGGSLTLRIALFQGRKRRDLEQSSLGATQSCYGSHSVILLIRWPSWRVEPRCLEICITWILGCAKHLTRHICGFVPTKYGL